MYRLFVLASIALALAFVAIGAAQTTPNASPSAGTPEILCATPVSQTSATPATVVVAVTQAALTGGVQPGTPVGLYQCAGTPSAGGQAQSQAANAAPTITMVGIAFQPNEFTIPANTDVTVTLTNSGAAMHNFSVTDHNNDDKPNLGISVDVNPGETKTVTVNAPAGDYYFFCNVPGHEAAGMHGTMHVQ